jgi:anti-anti-sigma factor
MRSDQEHERPALDFATRIVIVRDCPRVIVQGDIDLDVVADFQQALRQACDGATRIEVDLSDATFMDSTGLVILLEAHNHLGQIPEAVVLHKPSPAVQRVLDLAGVTDLFTVHTT